MNTLNFPLPAEQLARDIALLDHLTPAELAREIGYAEAAAVCDENDDDRRYRAELEKRAHLTTPLLPRALNQPTGNAFFDALAALPGAV